MSRQEKILLLYRLRSNYSAKAVADAWGVSDKKCTITIVRMG